MHPLVSPKKESALDCLRAVTSEAHQALHVHPFMLEHFDQGLTRDAYVGFLSLFRGLWLDLEHALLTMKHEPMLEPVHTSTSAKSPLLERDLLALGAVPEPHDAPGDPLLQARDPHHVLGYAYTLIGSSMGATQLLKRVHTQHPLFPTHYLAAPHARDEWRHLHRHLALSAIDCDEQHCVAQGSLVCFERVHEGFDRLLSSFSP